MKRWLGGLLVVFLVGCAAGPESIPVASAEMAARSGVSLATLQRGNAVYLSQCGRCHELIPPDQVKTADWHLVMPGMCWNAGLSKADEALALKYVLAASKK